MIHAMKRVEHVRFLRSTLLAPRFVVRNEYFGD